jgi:hypothetical protein
VVKGVLISNFEFILVSKMADANVFGNINMGIIFRGVGGPDFEFNVYFEIQDGGYIFLII